MADIRIRVNLGRLRTLHRELDRALEQAFNDCIDDLVRTSSEAAPHDKGILDKSYAKDVGSVIGGKIEGTVEYAVRERYSGGNYNYAIKMHEGIYNLGPGSLTKPGGTGMSGKVYRVGPKFLTAPLEGELETYKNHIKQELQRRLET